VKGDEQSAWVVVIAAFAVACLLLAVGTMFVSATDALPAFGSLAIILACLAAALAERAPRDRASWIVGILVAAFWTIGLWVLWRTWRVAGGFYDRLFPDISHDRFWRIAFQLVSIPTVALLLQVALIWLLVRLNDFSKRRREIIQQRRDE